MGIISFVAHIVHFFVGLCGSSFLYRECISVLVLLIYWWLLYQAKFIRKFKFNCGHLAFIKIKLIIILLCSFIKEINLTISNQAPTTTISTTKPTKTTAVNKKQAKRRLNQQQNQQQQQ